MIELLIGAFRVLWLAAIIHIIHIIHIIPIIPIAPIISICLTKIFVMGYIVEW